MAITTLSSREFDQNANDAEKGADTGPVFVTYRGKPAHVLLSIKEYGRITGRRQKIDDLLAMPGIADVRFDVPQLRGLPEPADLD